MENSRTSLELVVVQPEDVAVCARLELDSLEARGIGML
jgi:hypothetical protein